MSPVKRKPGESGFALLLVFLMAAVLAITLYMQIPRVAFQTQRQKEQLLIERGEQYKRAIQLFVRTNNRYPAEIKDLENFNNRRFLRHRFVDPMTGKDDWRLVHINNGVFTDSVLNKKKTDDPNQQSNANANTYVGVQPSIGQTPQTGQQNLNPAQTRRRGSEGGPATPNIGPDGQPIQPGQPITGVTPIPGQPFPGAEANPVQGQPMPGVQNAGAFFAGQIPRQPFTGGQPNPGEPQPFPVPGAQPNPNQPQAFPGVQPTSGTPVPPELVNQQGFNPAGQPPPGQPFPGQNITGAQIPGRLPAFQTPGAQNSATQAPTSSYVGGNQPYVGGSQPYVGGGTFVGGSTAPPPPAPTPTPFAPGQPNPQPVQNQPGFPGNPITPTAPVTPGFPANPTGGQGANPGFPAPNSAAAGLINNILTNPRPAPGGVQPSAPGGQQIGGGIAGIASKSENAAIMVYNDRTNYNEWEFVFDYTKQPPLPNPNGGVIGTPASALGSVPGAPVAGANASPVATPTTGAAIGANPNAAPGPGTPGQTPQTQGPASKPVLPPNLRPGRP